MANKKEQDNALLASLNTIKKSPTQLKRVRRLLQKKSLRRLLAKGINSSKDRLASDAKQATREVIPVFTSYKTGLA